MLPVMNHEPVRVRVIVLIPRRIVIQTRRPIKPIPFKHLLQVRHHLPSRQIFKVIKIFSDSQMMRYVAERLILTLFLRWLLILLITFSELLERYRSLHSSIMPYRCNSIQELRVIAHELIKQKLEWSERFLGLFLRYLPGLSSLGWLMFLVLFLHKYVSMGFLHTQRT